MFSKIHHAKFIITDEFAHKVDYQAMLPTVVYQFSETSALSLTTFVCHRNKSSHLILEFENKEKYEFRKPLCEFRKI